MAKPIQLRSHRVLIKAPRELVYQKMSSFGGGRLQGPRRSEPRLSQKTGAYLRKPVVRQQGLDAAYRPRPTRLLTRRVTG